MSEADQSVVGGYENSVLDDKRRHTNKEIFQFNGLSESSRLPIYRPSVCCQNATYTFRMAGEDFQSCFAQDIHQQNVDNINNTEMYSVLMDERRDISICIQMVIYIRIVDQNFIPDTYFLNSLLSQNMRGNNAYHI